MNKVEIHKCPDGKQPELFTVENRGDGWYLYSGDSRGNNPINFCPRCGEKLEKGETADEI